MKIAIKKSILTFSMVVLGVVCYSQPKPWSFGENVVISPNLYTGTMSLALPFYTYKDADFEIPVTFGYASNGCIANARGGIMGPGWGVNVGGSITREVRGFPDEGGNNNSNIYGFYKLHKSNTQESLPNILNKLFRVFGFGKARDIEDSPDYLLPSIAYSPNGNINYAKKPDNVYIYDAEPDIFHFNFMGYSGTFHLGLNDTIHIYNTNINNKDFRIEIKDTANSNGTCTFARINIYTPDGYKYIFDFNIQSLSVAYSEQDALLYGFYHYKAVEAMSWNLSKIIAPNGRMVTFDYERKKIINYVPAGFYSTGYYYSHVYGWLNSLNLFIRGENIHKLINDNEHLISESIIYMPILKTITIRAGNTNVSEIKFNHVPIQQDQYLASKSVPTNIDDESEKLSSIIVNNKLNNTTTKVKECNLTYMNNTNGARTTYLKDITIQGEGTYTMVYNKWNDSSIDYPANGTLSVDHWGYYNGKNNTNNKDSQFLNIKNLNSTLDESTIAGRNYRDSEKKYALCGMLDRITYPTGKYFIFYYGQNDYSKAVNRISSNNFKPQLVTETGLCGGLRISEINNYDENNTLIDSRSYNYINGSNGASFGILLNKPRYKLQYKANLNNCYITDDNIIFLSSDITEFNNLHIEYAKVVETLNDKSQIEYYFTNSEMSGYLDTINYTYVVEKTYHNNHNKYETWVIQDHSQATLCNIVAPVVSKQFIRGRLLKTNILRSYASMPLYTETNDYYNEYSNSKTYIPHYFVRALGYMPVYTGKYNAKSSTQTQYLGNTQISNTNSCTYNAYGQVASQTTTDSKGITQIVEYKYVTDTTTYPNGAGILDKAIRNNIKNLILWEKVYIVENGVKTLIGGKRYTYFNPVTSKEAMIRLQQVDSYDSEMGWIVDAKYNVYDNYGNLLEQENRNGVKTSYVWGYNGLYMIAKINNCSLSKITAISGLTGIQTTPLTGNISSAQENSLRAIKEAEVTTFEYKPLIGLSKIKDATGKSVSYDYNVHGKLEKASNTVNEPIYRYNYSTDNN
jgi:hypothetical protein